MESVQEQLVSEPTEGNHYSCADCQLSFSDHGELNNHIDEEHKTAKLTEALKATKDSKKGKKNGWDCGECGDHLATKDSYKQHLENVHKMGTIKYCPGCDKGYRNRTSLWKHQKSNNHWPPESDSPTSNGSGDSNNESNDV